MDRRELLLGSGIVALHAGSRALRLGVSEIFQPAKADFTLRIAPVSVELAPGKVVKTTGYNGTVSGPILRLREGVPVTVGVFNDTDTEELVHWHALKIPSDVDGAAEEGTPPVPAHGHRQYTFTPTPGGTRRYHTPRMLLAATSLQECIVASSDSYILSPKVSPAIMIVRSSWLFTSGSPRQQCT
jgi:FtsP/CotA-like multicopper oxidase with cupredoxin domain